MLNMEATTALTTLPPLAVAKNVGYIAAFFVGTTWLGFEPQSVAIFATLMTLDVVTGVARAYLVQGGTSVRSAILSKGIIAKLLLLLVPIAAALALKGVGFQPQLLAQGVINILILSEAYSILGNIHSALTRSVKNEFDAVAVVLNVIKKALDNTIRDKNVTN